MELRIGSCPRGPLSVAPSRGYTRPRGVRGDPRRLVLDGLGGGTSGRAPAPSRLGARLRYGPRARPQPRVRPVPRGHRRRPAPMVGGPALRRSGAAGGRRELARRADLLPVAIGPHRHSRAAPVGGRVGEGGAGRPGRRALSLGRRAPGPGRLRSTAPPRGDAGQPAGAARALRRLPRVVSRLGGGDLLRAIARSRSPRPGDRHAPRLTWRSVATPGSVEPGGPSLLATPGPALLRLRLPARARLVP